MHKRAIFYSALTAAWLTLGTTATLQAAGEHENGHAHGQDQQAHTHGFALGEPAEGSEPDRIIEIDATDSMKFDPSEIEVETGEVVRFVIENTGTLHHSFTIGNSKWHQEHEDEMQGMSKEKLVSHMRDEPNGTVVPPGETRSLTWKFKESGVVEIGCHVPGHYPAGMKGEIEVG